MHLLIPPIIVALLFYIWPGGAKYLFVAPLFGVATGGLAWGIVAMMCSYLITMHAFGLFLFFGIVFAEILAVFID